MRTPEEIDSYLGYLDQKINRALGAVSAINGSLATGSTWQRINGQLLIPDSVVTDVIAPNAITETEIDADAVSTPKLQANSITAAKLEANLVLSSKIIGGTYSSPNTFGVELSSAGLKLFDGSGVQRGWLKTDGSGWFGSSTSFYWDTAGSITVAGVTVASAASGARVELNSSGLYMKNSSNQTVWELTTSGQKWWNPSGAIQRGQILQDGSGWIGSSTGFSWDSAGNLTATGMTTRSASTTAKAQLTASGLQLFNSSGTNTGLLSTDGSGFLGSTDGSVGNAAISWNTAGTAIINASRITTGTLNAGTISVTNLNATNLTSGSLGGGGSGINLGSTYGLGINGNLTLGAGGKIIDADGSYWDQTGIVLKSSGAYGDSIKWNQGGTDIGTITGSTSGMFMYQGSSTSGTSHLSLSSTSARIQHGSSGYFLSVSGAGVQTGGPIYPGTTGLIQANNSLSYVSEGIAIVLGDAGGTYAWDVRNSSGTRVFGVSSNGSLFRAVANDSTAAGTYYGRVPFYINGTLKYMHVFNA